MKVFTMARAVLGLALAITASYAPAAKTYTGDSLIAEGFTEVSEGVYFRNTPIALSVNGSSSGNELAAQTHFCQISDYEGTTGDYSAKVDDCWQVYRNVAVDGEWYVPGFFVASFMLHCLHSSTGSSARVTRKWLLPTAPACSVSRPTVAQTSGLATWMFTAPSLSPSASSPANTPGIISKGSALWVASSVAGILAMLVSGGSTSVREEADEQKLVP